MLKLSIVFLSSLTVLWLGYCIYTTYADNDEIKIPVMDALIANQSTNWQSPDGTSQNVAEISFLKINQIGFATDNENLFIKFNLNDRLPDSNHLPIYNGEQLRAVFFYANLFLNYQDKAGNLTNNPADASIEITFYGTDPNENTNNKRIFVEGDLISGGPGFNYFIVMYNYHALLTGQENDSVVFNASSLAVTNQHPLGISKYIVTNKILAAAPSNPNDIRIDLSLKP